MYLNAPIVIAEQKCHAIELVTTIYSGHAAETERVTATAKIIPLTIDDEGNLRPIEGAENNITLTIDESTPPELLQYVAQVQSGIRGVIKAVLGYPV